MKEQIYFLLKYRNNAEEGKKADWTISSSYYALGDKEAAKLFDESDTRMFTFPQLEEVSAVDIKVKTK